MRPYFKILLLVFALNLSSKHKTAHLLNKINYHLLQECYDIELSLK